MKKGIAVKLFAITALFFVFLISTFIIFQTLIFERYYEAKKTGGFKTSFQRLYTQYLENGIPVDVDLTSDYLKEFRKQNNAKVGMVSISPKGLRVTMLTAEGENKMYLETIKKEGFDSDKFPDIPMRVTIGPLSKNDDFIYALNEFLEMTKNESLTNKPNPSGPVIFKLDNQTGGVKNIVAAVLLNGNASSGNYLLAVSSLQPVGEAVSVIKDLSIFFGAFGILLIMLLAFIFSNMVSKPLIRLNGTAARMAELDFSVRCEEKMNDEIGSLARNLNFLSDNLYNALNDLKAANSQLTEDIEKERQLEKMRKEFVAGVSHELKTPISLIMGYAEGLKDNLVEGVEKERYFNVIADEAGRMSNLINDMLDLSQLESGKFKLNMEEFYISELVKYIIGKFNRFFAEKQLNVELQMPGEDIIVYADEFRIEQVISNFLNNAIRHTPEKGTISIAVKEMTSSVRVEIENQGNQVEEHELESIWQKFYKAEKSRNRACGGTGLGLSIVRNILQLHGSEHGAENTGRGVKFFFHLAKGK